MGYEATNAGRKRTFARVNSLRRYLLLLTLSLLLALPACQRPEEPPRPASLLSKEQMKALLTGLHLLEARVDASHLSGDSARALYLTQQRDLFWQFETTDSVFQRSYRYYGVHGKDLDEIYQGVLDSLGSKEREFGQQSAPPAAPPGHSTFSGR
jgi:hypothetical protein